jgi:ParB-like chromosome segregation protein Spo0J
LQAVKAPIGAFFIAARLAESVQKLYVFGVGDLHILAALRGLGVPVASLRINENTPVLHTNRSIAALQASISMFGQYRPVVARTSTRVIILGTGLFVAMQRASYDTIACIFADVDEETAASMILADNQIGRMSSYSNRHIETLIHRAQSKFSSIPGWSDYELSGLLGDSVRSPKQTEDYVKWLPERFRR